MEANRKRAQVHRLPTEDVSQIHHNKVRYPNEIKYELSFHKEPSKCKNDGLCSGNQHLYITTDDKIKEGDWYIIQGASPEGVYNTLPNGGVKKEFAKKIIATTDPKLTELSKKIDETYFMPRLPQPTQAFIEEYCKRGGIDEVLVEVVEHCSAISDYIQSRVVDRNIYLKPLLKDNTIIIHPVEEMYTADSINTLRKLANAIIGPASEILPDTYDKELKAYWDWIEENL